MPGVAKKAFRQFGFQESQIILRWRDLMGPVMADHTEPVKLIFPRGKRTGATLHLRASPGFALELQHLEPLIVEKINGFFGYGAVGKLSILQGPVKVKGKRKHKNPGLLNIEQTEELETALQNTHDADLKAALLGLGSDILAGKDS